MLRRLGRPSREKAIEIARQICLGLAAAHENQVLHRDLKPANIMIDGRGRVRITDFGLAGFLDDLEGREARAGTPAYMAPEQLAHGKVSVCSDIYTLGLLLHELFTGHSVFDTNDVEELKRRHDTGSATPSSSSISEEIDPAVERVIMRCLEADPEHRPQSVYQILAALPGGDPLAAALAAGETPSPELVVNARDFGGLRPVWAIGLLVSILAVMVLTGFAAGLMNLNIPRESPAATSAGARQLMQELGYDELPRNSMLGMDTNLELSNFFDPRPEPYREATNVDWPPSYRFWQRWSRGAFSPVGFHTPQRYSIDGDTTDEGATATLALDETGRLLGLVVGPAFFPQSSRLQEPFEWSRTLELAGFDEANVEEVPPLHPPPVFCDQVIAWRLSVTKDPEDAVMVQAGAFGGRLSSFEVVGLDEDMTSPLAAPGPTSFVILFLLAFMAWRNLRAARGDMRNAFRCGLLIGALYAALELNALDER